MKKKGIKPSKAFETGFTALLASHKVSVPIWHSISDEAAKIKGKM